MKASKRPLAIIRTVTVRSIGKFIIRVRSIVQDIGDHALIFVTPAPALATVISDTDDLEAAQALAETRAVGTAAARNLKYDIVLDDVRKLQGYVQELADAAPDEATAISIIAASGFDLKNKGVRVKAPIAVKHGEVSGQVKLYAKADPEVKSPLYEWAKSKDGIVWEIFTTTLRGHAVVNGLQPESKMYFRVRIKAKGGDRA